MEMIKVMREHEQPRVVVSYDSSPDEPPLDVTTLLHWHGRWNMHSEAEKINPSDYGSDEMTPIADLIESHELVAVWPLFLYEHGGSALSVGTAFSCIWDSGQVGFVGVTKAQWALLTDDEWKGTDEQKERALKAITAQIEVLDDWHNGRVFGFEVYDDEGEVEDSCWGFYGSDTKTNGMRDYVDEKYWEMLDEAMEDPQV